MHTATGTPPLARVTIATRESALAMWQARNIQRQLISLYPRLEVAISAMTTRGDQLLATRLDKIGGKGLFVKELEDALAEGRADIAVHSMKDVPMVLPPGFGIAAITEREDARDAYVSNQFSGLDRIPAGGVIGTSSLRRESQIRARYPELQVDALRGNVPTRLKKLDNGDYAAIILAAAGLKRLGMEERIGGYLSPEDSLPAPGQGALGIECRDDRPELFDMIGALAHQPTAICVRAERAVSRALSGSCRLPLGAYAVLDDGRLCLSGFVGSQDGKRVVRAGISGDTGDPESLGAELAQRLRQLGASEILEALEPD